MGVPYSPEFCYCMKQYLFKKITGMVLHTCNSITCKVKVGGSEVQIPQLHSKLNAKLLYKPLSQKTKARVGRKRHGS